MATCISSLQHLSNIGHRVVDHSRRSGAIAEEADHDHGHQTEETTVLDRRAQAARGNRALDVGGQLLRPTPPPLENISSPYVAAVDSTSTRVIQRCATSSNMLGPVVMVMHAHLRMPQKPPRRNPDLTTPIR